MADLLDRIHDELRARLAELRPLVDEYTHLEAAARALDAAKQEVSPQTPATAAARPAKAPAPRRPAAKRARAPRGANRAAVLAAVGERPGVTRGELATVAGVAPNTLSALLSRLVKAGELRTTDLPSGHTGYALNDPSSAPPTPGDSEVAPEAEPGVEAGAEQATVATASDG